MILHFFCPTCEEDVKKLFGDKEQIQKTHLCEKCHRPLMTVLNPPTLNSVEKIDNGCMEKAVEYDEQKANLIKEASNKLKHNKKR